jgi:hypothetical protein
VILGINVSGVPGLPYSAINSRILANRFSLELKKLIYKVGLNAHASRHQVWPWTCLGGGIGI